MLPFFPHTSSPVNDINQIVMGNWGIKKKNHQIILDHEAAFGICNDSTAEHQSINSFKCHAGREIKLVTAPVRNCD